MAKKVVFDIQAKISGATKDIKKLGDASDKTAKQVGKISKETSKTAELLGKASVAMAGFVSVAAIGSLVKQVIAVRSEFAKFEAVLTNTLGSAKQAAIELDRIKRLAAATPFSVIQLTNAFVKLTNQGLKPSMEEMRKYGDLAASVGKEFDQLAEAVIDATVGEMERLKEFGVKAAQAGDMVSFTFKGVTTEVEKTSIAIKEYILSLGDLEGVSGGMDAISETLGGRLSMLTDAWESLLNTIGEFTETGGIGAIDALTRLLANIESLLFLIDKLNGPTQEGIPEMTTGFGKLKEVILDTGETLVKFVGGMFGMSAAIQGLGLRKTLIDTARATKELDEIFKLIDEDWNIFLDSLGDFDEKAEVIEEEITTINSLSKDIKELTKEISKTNIEDEESIRILNDKVRLLKEQVKALKELTSIIPDLAKVEDIEMPEFDPAQDWDEFIKEQDKALEKSNQQAIEALEERAEAAIDVEKERIEREIELRRAAATTQMFIASDLAAGLVALSNELFGESKALSIATTLIDTYAAAVAAYRSVVGIPFVGPAAAPAAAAAAIAFGLAQVAKIASFMEGGFTGPGKGFKDKDGKIAGYVHENEFVFDQQKTRMLRPLFEDIHNDRINISGLAKLTRGDINNITNNEFNARVLEREVGRIYDKMGVASKHYAYSDENYMYQVRGNTTTRIRK